ncbi:ABC transporter permease [Dactylosporangium sp. NPDC048998]|uniref:ABC transporter permease n=1 Tax=Dactylosporangium sp. NPDC048998 TaxID=3363976 RepID=UPI0037153712
MTALDVRPAETATVPRMGQGPADVLTATYRHLLRLKHAPGQIISTLMFPLAFVVLFGFVFGSAIPIDGGANYREYLIPGLLVLTIFTNIMATMIAVARDNGLGVMDRFRSMPVARSAILFGQALADLISMAVTLLFMLLCGLVVGWRAHNGVGQFLAAFGLLLLLQFATSWVGVYFGTTVKNLETAGKLGPLIMPLTMISNVFVPTQQMPLVLRVISNWNPVSCAVAACRHLFGNPGVPQGDVAWPIAHPVVATLGWSVLLLAIFVPLAVRRFQIDES